MISLFELVFHCRKSKRQEYRKYTEAMWRGNPKRNHKAYSYQNIMFKPDISLKLSAIWVITADLHPACKTS